MARKLVTELATTLHLDAVRIQRMIGSLERPLSPEGKRVLAAARVGLRVLRERLADHDAKVTDLHERRKLRAITLRGPNPVREDNLPGSIREMLADHRRAEGGQSTPAGSPAGGNR